VQTNSIRIDDPFAGIEKSSPKTLDLYRNFFGADGAAELAPIEKDFRLKYPPGKLATLTLGYLVMVAMRSLGKSSIQMFQGDGQLFPSVLKALGNIALQLTEAIEENINEGRDPYPWLTQRSTCDAFLKMRFEIQRAAAAARQPPVVFGSLNKTVELFKSLYQSPDLAIRELGILLWSARQSAIRVWAKEHTESLDLGNLQEKALKYIAGLSDSTDPFLCDRMRVSAEREQYDEVDLLSKDYLHLPTYYDPSRDHKMKGVKRHVTGDNSEDRRTRYPLMLALDQRKYQQIAAKRQPAYLVSATLNQLRERVKTDDAPYIKAEHVSFDEGIQKSTEYERLASQFDGEVDSLLAPTREEILFAYKKVSPKDAELLQFTEAWLDCGMSSLKKLPKYLTHKTGSEWSRPKTRAAYERFRYLLPRIGATLQQRKYEISAGSRKLFYKERVSGERQIYQLLDPKTATPILKS
jgi:hypothetical protein